MLDKMLQRRLNLVRCDYCCSDAFVRYFDGALVSYGCAGPFQHVWTEERDPRCVRCAECLSEHSPVVNREHGSALVCPGVLTDHTFSPTN